MNKISQLFNISGSLLRVCAVKFFTSIGVVLSFLFPSKLLRTIRNIIDYIRTGYCKSSFNYLGGRTVLRKNVLILGGSNITIGKQCHIQSRTVLSTWDNGANTPSKLLICDGVNIGEGCHLTAVNSITIGKGSLLGKYVTVTDNSHGQMIADEAGVVPYRRKVFSKGPVVIGERVWIGDKATILPGVTIGDDAIIGANSVVSKDIPPRTVVAGVPAKVIKKY